MQHEILDINTCLNSFIKMEAFPKIVHGGPPKNRIDDSSEKKPFRHCNICRNYKNINDKFHRNSKVHQRKLTDRFRVIRSQMKMINLDSVIVHDEEWGQEENIYCYFCSKAVPKHKLHDEVMVEFLGYLSHLVSSEHKESIKSYLKFHGRKEKWQQFSKASFELENFLAKVSDAKALYMKKLEILNQKDVMKIKEVEFQRQNLLEESQQLYIGTSSQNVDSGHHERNFEQTGCSLQNAKQLKFDEKIKLPPWLINEAENETDKKQISKPVIGPTMETLVKHVHKQKKKGLPGKLLTGNFKTNSSFSKTWLPEFGGVWNKGRHRKRKYKMVSKAKRK